MQNLDINVNINLIIGLVTLIFPAEKNVLRIPEGDAG